MNPQEQKMLDRITVTKSSRMGLDVDYIELAKVLVELEEKMNKGTPSYDDPNSKGLSSGDQYFTAKDPYLTALDDVEKWQHSLDSDDTLTTCLYKLRKNHKGE